MAFEFDVELDSEEADLISRYRKLVDDRDRRLVIAFVEALISEAELRSIWAESERMDNEGQ